MTVKTQNGSVYTVIHVHNHVEGNIVTVLYPGGWKMRKGIRAGATGDTYPEHIIKKYEGKECYRLTSSMYKVVKAVKKKLII